MNALKKLAVVLFVTAVFVGASALLPLDERSPARAAGDGYEMVAELGVVMGYVDEVFTTISDKIEADKLRSVRDDAMFLAELLNVSLYSEEWRDKEGWKKYCDSGKKDLVALSAAAKAKDKAKVASLLKKVEASCEGCHDEIRDA